MNTPKVALLILDGWGLGTKTSADAIQQASTPYMDKLFQNHPHSTLVTYGEEVGLPNGQMGNSEVGHMNIGAGRIVFQELARINNAVSNQSLANNQGLQDCIRYAKANNKPIHLMGLLSDGGVHSHIQHLLALIDIMDEAGCPQVFIHAFMDGRDTDPRGGIQYMMQLIRHLAQKNNAALASVIGRYYAMDRDKRWERTSLAYHLLVHGQGEPTMDIIGTIQECYEKGETDEFLKPIVCTEFGKPVATIEAEDAVLFFNFRTDRPRQITQVLTQEDFLEHNMKTLPLYFVTMTRYDETFKNLNVLFEKEDLKDTLGEVLAAAQKSQVRIAETEKYPHVTFFFSGGTEQAFEGERRLLIPSPKVATYDLQPEMSANKITDTIITDISENTPDFICLNYANTDMVGHTGDFEAAKVAAQTVDTCLNRLIPILQKNQYHTIIIADHGNSDYMINEDGSPNTAHTTNLVPCIFIPSDDGQYLLKDGKLADIAPTILQLMEIAAPEKMTGEVLVQKI